MLNTALTNPGFGGSLPPHLAWTIEEAATAIGVSRSTMYALVASGNIPTVRIGRCRRLMPQDVARFLDDQRE